MNPLWANARHLHPASLQPPPSKSDAHRALVLAHLLGVPAPSFVDAPRDISVLTTGLDALSRGVAKIDCHDAGAPFRFLLAQAAAHPRTTTFQGSSRLGVRPHDALMDALRQHGVVIHNGNPWPITVKGAAWEGPAVLRIDASQSSQFASALLLLAGHLVLSQQRAWTVELQGTLASPGYLDMTISWMRAAGFVVEVAGALLRVASHSPATLPPVPADWSSASYLLLWAWKTGGRVMGLDLQGSHPDRALLAVLEALGLRILGDATTGVTVEGVARGGLDLSCVPHPDLMPTLGALACVLPLPSRFRDVGVLRAKESDRVAGMVELVEAAGGQARLDGDTLHLQPPAHVADKLHIQVSHDHRRAMAAVTLAVLSNSQVRVDDADVVAKSFPGFWKQAHAVGVVTSSG